MPDAADPLARALDDLRSLAQSEAASGDVAYAAGLTEAIGVIEQAAEAADPPCDCGVPWLHPAAADPTTVLALPCRACRHVVHPDADCGIPMLTHEGTMPCDCDPCGEWCIEQAAEAEVVPSDGSPSSAAALDHEALAEALGSWAGRLDVGGQRKEFVEHIAAAYAAAKEARG